MKKKVFMVILSALIAASMLSGCFLIPSRDNSSSRNNRSNRYDDDDDDYDDDYDDDDINDTLVDNDDPVFADTEWADVYIYGDDYDLKAEVTPRSGIPDDFEIYDGAEILYFVPEEKRSAVEWYMASMLLHDKGESL